MARFNEILSGRFNRGIQKLFSMKGGPPAPQLASEITVNHQLYSGVENRYLEGWNRFGVGAQVAAGGAGNRAAVRIRNPFQSGILVVIEKISFSSSLQDFPLVTLGAATDLGGVVTVNSGFDNRGAPTPVAIVSASGAAVFLGFQIWQGAMPVNSTLDVIQLDDQELALLPQTTVALGNGAITAYSGVLNQALNVAIWWRERVLEDSERT
jgi:hypothetical protein